MWVTPSSGDGSHGGLDFASPSGCLCIPCARSCALGWYGLASKIMPPRIGMVARDGCASRRLLPEWNLQLTIPQERLSCTKWYSTYQGVGFCKRAPSLVIKVETQF